MIGVALSGQVGEHSQPYQWKRDRRRHRRKGLGELRQGMNGAEGINGGLQSVRARRSQINNYPLLQAMLQIDRFY